MKILITTILLLSGTYFLAGTAYDKTQDIKIASMQKTIDSLKTMSNILYFYSPVIGRDSVLNGKKMGFVIEIKK